MLRTVLGYAVLAVIAFVVLSLAASVLGFVLSIAVKLALLAAVGFGCYVVLKVISPGAARRVRELIAGQGPTST